ncbi:hypothetical protein CYY_004837 [Polysphondylium violaceum]|uniref:G domain-containing protein n=1 Tax=Polysphondylium violaceum TaxID=133409 RepID=A0A8J4Q4L6_9MYCE|nr:hypothetical protein CYY_004837 [Polysphondylium violaceum]
MNSKGESNSSGTQIDALVFGENQQEYIIRENTDHEPDTEAENEDVVLSDGTVNGGSGNDQDSKSQNTDHKPDTKDNQAENGDVAHSVNGGSSNYQHKSKSENGKGDEKDNNEPKSEKDKTDVIVKKGNTGSQSANNRGTDENIFLKIGAGILLVALILSFLFNFIPYQEPDPISNQDPIAVLLAGNPGSTKSTICSTLADSPGKCRSGIAQNDVGGLTKEIQIVPMDGYVIIDTPGLYDPISLKNNCQEILKALTYSTKKKLIFAVLSTDGRIDGSESGMVNLILKSLPYKVPYGIIYSKVGRRSQETLKADQFHTFLEWAPFHYIILDKLEELVDKDDMISSNKEYNEKVKTFVDKTPYFNATKDKIKPIECFDIQKEIDQRNAQYKAEIEKERRLIQEQLEKNENLKSCKIEFKVEEQPFEETSVDQQQPHTRIYKWKPVKVIKTTTEIGILKTTYVRMVCETKSGDVITNQDWQETGKSRIVTFKDHNQTRRDVEVKDLLKMSF